MRRTLLVVLLALSGLGSASASDNPVEADVVKAIDSGDCGRAFDLVEPFAEKGETWAQFHMGMLIFTCRARNDRYEDAMGEGLKWFSRAAALQITDPWLKGDRSNGGSPGMFNAREDAAKAAQFLHTFLKVKGKNKEAWQALIRAQAMFEPSEAAYVSLEERIKSLESYLSPGTIAYWRAELEPTLSGSAKK